VALAGWSAWWLIPGRGAGRVVRLVAQPPPRYLTSATATEYR